jgi:Vitamin K-dependent gamma-carboxylase
MNALSQLFRAERNTYVLGLMRIALSAMLLRHVVRLATELSHQGYFAEHFFIPLLPHDWVPSNNVYRLLLSLMAIAAVAAMVGVRAREGALFAALGGLYILLCDRLQYHNNRYVLLLLALLLAFTPCDRVFALGSAAAGKNVIGPRWAVTLMQLQVSLIYATSAGSKLLDPDWRGGQVLLLRAVRGLELAAQQGIALPGFAIALGNSALCMSVVSKLAIATELFLAVGLWRPRLRALALWIGVLFHLGIELSARVELFSYVMGASYLTFVTPELHERTLEYRPDVASAAWLARGVRWLDWLARFRIEVSEAHTWHGAAFRVRDRAGHWTRGIHAIAAIARAIPLLFPLWLPLRICSALCARPGLRASFSRSVRPR